MAPGSDRNFFTKLSSRSKTIIMIAVFALFAPLPLILTAPVGLGRDWLQVIAWFVLGGAIAVSWAYCYFEQKLLWLPPIVTVVLSMAFPLADSLSMGALVSSALPVAIVAVGLVVIGYVGFVAFIGIEGTRTVRMQAELDVAQRIHSYIVPDISFENDLFEIRAVSIASTEMGGDVTDVTEVGETVAVTIADVSGHGVPAGILMSALKGSLVTALSHGDGQPGDFLQIVNRTFHRISSPDMYCTLATIILNSSRSGIIYNAGHSATLHYRANNERVEQIESSGIPVGIMSDFQCDGSAVTLESGDILALFTDGLTETENASGEMLGIEPLADELATHAESSAKKILTRFFDRASEFGTTDDDRSVVIVRVK